MLKDMPHARAEHDSTRYLFLQKLPHNTFDVPFPVGNDQQRYVVLPAKVRLDAITVSQVFECLLAPEVLHGEEVLASLKLY